MADSKLDNLMKERQAVLGFVYRAQARLADINEQIRLAGGNPNNDFSGAVRRLKESGVLPK
jgi:hypothetical protein